ncbi:MAG: restriction endonuclease subunit S, partial [Candidatus Calescibacterium sp.]|nr:restriction endonuclease subunit S [Candidatus Calescibacterium sp.]MDW8195940.1 restriction endonuclease subunit S [Candidatus Calescibacterium sp.]
IHDNTRKPVKKEDRIPGDIPYCGANGVIDFVDGYTHEGEYVLIAEDGGFYGPYEQTSYIMKGKFWANNHVHVVSSIDGVIVSEYLNFWINRADLRDFLTGATRPKLNQSSMLKIPIPLPPLQEQKRIVQKIQQIFSCTKELKREVEEARKEAEALWKSVLFHTFPRPGSELPEGWKWVKLGEVAERISETINPSAHGEKEFAYIGMEDVRSGQFDEPKPRYVKGLEIKSQVVVFKPGFVMYGKLRPYLNKVFVPSFDGVASTEFIPLKVDEKVALPLYVATYLRSPFFVEYANKNTNGTRQPRVKIEAVFNALIPLPPLQEQKRIVQKIQQVFSCTKELKREVEEARKEAEALWKSVLFHTFPRPGSELPEGWKWVKLGEVARIFSGSPAPQESKYFENGIYPFVRVSDLSLSHGYELLNTKDSINQKAVEELHLVKAKPGTVLFPRSGAAILTNRKVLLAIDAYIVSHLAAVEPIQSILDSKYALYAILTIDMKNHIDNPSYPSLKLSKISQLSIPLPPLQEQKRIVQKIQEIFSRTKELKREVEGARKEAEALWKSVLFHTFPRPGSELPEGWKWVKLGEVARIFSGSPAPQESKY